MRAREAREAYTRKRDQVLWMVLQGIPTEPGVHSVNSKVVQRKARLGMGVCQHYRLIVR